MPESTPDPQSTAHQLRASVGPLSRRLRQLRAEGELSLSQSSVLARLDRDGPASPSELAIAEQIRAQSLVPTLAALERRGFVRRHADSSDGRRVVVAITAPGSKWLVGARRETGNRLAQAIEQTLTPREHRQLARALPLLERISRVL